MLIYSFIIWQAFDERREPSFKRQKVSKVFQTNETIQNEK